MTLSWLILWTISNFKFEKANTFRYTMLRYCFMHILLQFGSIHLKCKFCYITDRENAKFSFSSIFCILGYWTSSVTWHDWVVLVKIPLPSVCWKTDIFYTAFMMFWTFELSDLWYWSLLLSHNINKMFHILKGLLKSMNWKGEVHCSNSLTNIRARLSLCHIIVVKPMVFWSKLLSQEYTIISNQIASKVLASTRLELSINSHCRHSSVK